MNETLKIKKTGKSTYGHYILVDDGAEKPNFKGVTEQVSGFLSKQIPCSILVEEQGEKGIITRVKVVQGQQDNSMNEFEQPVETVKPGIEPATNYKPSYTDRISDVERQTSIEGQMSIYAAIQMIEAHNKISDTKIEPNMNNLLNNANIVKEVLNKLKEPIQDY